MTDTNNFRIDSVGSYKDASGYKIEILYEDLHGWPSSKGKYYSTDGASHSGRKQYDIIAKWEEPSQAFNLHNPWGDLGTINSDNSKVNANALERIEELEGALREVKSMASSANWIADCELGTEKRLYTCHELAKKALGETK